MPYGFIAELCDLRSFMRYLTARITVRKLWKSPCTAQCRTQHYIFSHYHEYMPVPVAARSKAWVCGRSPAEIVGSNPTGGARMFICCECCQVEVSATSWSLVQRSPTDSGGSLCFYLETSWMRRPWPTGGLSRQKQRKLLGVHSKPFIDYIFSLYDGCISW
jgi:hypothetical protein